MERIKFNLDIPQDIKLIHKIFKDNGFKLFIVGGSIRDALLDKTPKDWDLATDAIPNKVESMMKEAGLRTIATGKAFGIINVFTDNDEFEVATFRNDIGSDGRRPDSVTFTTIEGDVLRRDLTINALFFDLDTSEVVDLVGGVEDLKNGIIRTVGNAEDRFNEDRLRILRSIRFAARFSNGLHSDIIDALNKDSRLGGFPITTYPDGSTSSRNISAERIRDEFLKGLRSANSTIFFLEMLDSFNLFDWIFPNITLNKKFIEDKDPMIIIASLMKFNKFGDCLKKQFNKLSYSLVEICQIEFLVNLSNLNMDNVVAFKKTFKTSKLSNNQLKNMGTREGMSIELLDAFENFELSVKGEDVMKKFNLQPGKELGDRIIVLETENFRKLIYNN